MNCLNFSELLFSSVTRKTNSRYAQFSNNHQRLLYSLEVQWNLVNQVTNGPQKSGRIKGSLKKRMTD